MSNLLLPNRRTLLTGIGASAAYAALGRTKALAQTTGVTFGVIRWDAWYAQTGSPRQAQNALGPAAARGRAAWFAQNYSADQVNVTGTQANLDFENVLAAQAGFTHWAFVRYRPAAGGNPGGEADMDIAWGLYQSSPTNNLIKWCNLLSTGGYLGCDPWGNTAGWQANVNQLVADMTPSAGKPTYQTVLSGRPLLYILWNNTDLTTYFAGSTANVNTAIAYLRSQCSVAGIGNPYVVSMGVGGVVASAAFMTAIGADAISNYQGALGAYTQLPETAADADTQNQASWAGMAALGNKMVPNLVAGWDQRPRIQNPETFAGFPMGIGQLKYYLEMTDAQVATLCQECINFIGSNLTLCESKAMLMYAWDEDDEGGRSFRPQLRDPPVNGNPPTSNLLNAVGTVLRAAA